ncbi:MAG: hypothetical protein WD469_15125 [Paenibacillaceae bacterium]
MNWFTSLFRGGMLKKGLQQQMQTPNRNMLGRRTIMSLLALASGAVAYGVVRRRNGGGNLFQQITQPLRRLFR